jgi:wyosine [tRNA(Phe)-imidazoG37] synthetase (radical SAM superfamily)
MITFGPVPSRRLGNSLGINNIPPKICSYSCVYCQIGKAIKIQFTRQQFYSPDQILADVEQTLNTLAKKNIKVDYLSFVPDGEPTLDINLGKSIRILKKFNIPIAVITNASLIWQEQVQQDLAQADLVNVKVDAVSEHIWKRIDKPHKNLNLQQILNGILLFSKSYNGILYTETMLVKDKNDIPDEIEKIAQFIAQVNPHTAFIGIPTRPPAENVLPADEHTINFAYNSFKNYIKNVELLLGSEAGNFASTSNIQDDILRITAVHPMSQEAMDKFLKQNNASMDIVNQLLEKGLILKTSYRNKTFYIRRFKKN